MKTSSLLLLLVLVSGCATRTWTEQTDIVRPAGETTERTENRLLAEEYFELRTATETDGYVFEDTVYTDADGNLNINLLPAALQALTYAHDVTLELYSFREDKIVWSRTVTLDDARGIVREWSVQAGLGAEVRLRNRQADLLDRAIERVTEPMLRDNLETIRLKVTIRPDWE